MVGTPKPAKRVASFFRLLFDRTCLSASISSRGCKSNHLGGHLGESSKKTKIFSFGRVRNFLFLDSWLVRRLVGIEKARQTSSATQRRYTSDWCSGGRPSTGCVVRLGARSCNPKDTTHSDASNRQTHALSSGRHQLDCPVRLLFRSLESEW